MIPGHQDLDPHSNPEDLNILLDEIQKTMERHKRALRWDWWTIGGEFSGQKVYARLDQRSLDKFIAESERRRLWHGGRTDKETAAIIRRLKNLFMKYFPDFEGEFPFKRKTGASLPPFIVEPQRIYPDDIAKIKDTKIETLNTGYVLTPDDFLESERDFQNPVANALKQLEIEDGWLVGVEIHR